MTDATEPQEIPTGNWIEVFERGTEPETFGVRLHLRQQSFELAYHSEDRGAADWYAQVLGRALRKFTTNDCQDYHQQNVNDQLRKKWAESPMDCLYCGLSKADMAKCVSGFPGCGRADCGRYRMAYLSNLARSHP